MTSTFLKDVYKRQLEHRYHTLMQVFRRHNEDYENQVVAGMKAKGTLLTVSYTHLDVYKRQYVYRAVTQGLYIYI